MTSNDEEYKGPAVIQKLPRMKLGIMTTVALKFDHFKNRFKPLKSITPFTML